MSAGLDADHRVAAAEACCGAVRAGCHCDRGARACGAGIALGAIPGGRRTVNVRAAFPGWVEPMDAQWKRDSGKSWVLEPKALAAFIENEPETIAESDVALAAYHLSRYVPATGAN
jgi:hypothetical protein